MYSFRIYAADVILVLAVSACGIKAPPQPRETVVPMPVEDLKLTVTKQGILLEWTIPTRSLDGSPLREVAGYKVVRTGPDAKSVRTEVWFPLSERKNKVGEKASFVDSFPSEKGFYHFWVIPFDAYGSSARPGDGATINWEGAS